MANDSSGKSSGGLGSAIIAIVIVLIILGGLGSCMGGSDDDKDYSAKCTSCNRTYTDSDNKWSIFYRNMCERCYENFKWVQEALKGVEY